MLINVPSRTHRRINSPMYMPPRQKTRRENKLTEIDSNEERVFTADSSVGSWLDLGRGWDGALSLLGISAILLCLLLCLLGDGGTVGVAVVGEWLD